MYRTTASAAAMALCLTAGAQAQTSDSGAQQFVDEIVVTGRAQEFYLQTAPSLGNKFPGDIREIPQSIQILSEQLIKDQAAVEITDLYRNISSVSVFSYSGVTFRGFRQDEIRYDGLLGDPFSGFSVPLLFDIEQVEIVKGPSGALFGGGEPGGVINYVTRSPSDDLEGYVTGVAGNYDLYGARGEISGPIDEDGRVLFRVGGAYENTDTFRFNTNKEDIVVAADLEWRPTEATSALFKFDYIEQDFQGARLRGVPVDGDGNFLTTRRFNTNEETDFQRLEATVFTASLNHQFNDDLSFTLAGRYIDSQETQNYHENRGDFINDDGVAFARREFRDQMRDIQQYTALAELVYNFDLGATEHTFLIGGEYYRRENKDFFLTSSDSGRANQLPPNFIVPDLNFFDPDYGNSNPSLFDPFVEIDREIDFDQWSFYVQDQIQLTERLTLSLGGRLEGFSEDLDQVRTNLLTGASDGEPVSESDEALTVRTGVVYDVTDNIATYFNYSTGFTPQGAASQPDTDDAVPFAPERGRLFEAGTKVDLFSGAVYLQLAAYQINKTNLLVADPSQDADTGDLVAIGEARSRGIELDIVGDITDEWTFTLSYGYNDTVILEGGDKIINVADGSNEFANAPDHQLGFWTRYDIAPINSAIAFGGQYVSEQVSLSSQRVQPYAIFDASWITTWRNLQFQINARNLFDKVYAESGFLARTGHFPGEPRTFRAEVTARF